VILLTPVLTAAFIADTTAKKDKSKEWDRQIAAVQQESRDLRERQLAAWGRLQRRSVSNGAWQQRRMYSATAQATKVDDDMEDPIDHTVVDQDPQQDEEPVTPDQGISEDKIQAVQRFDRLIATRMALQLLLQLKSGESTVFTMPIETVPSYFTAKHQSLDYILKELEKVGRMLHKLYRQKLPYGAVHPSDYLERRDVLSNELNELTDRYRKADIHLPEFVMSYINLISKHRMGPPVSNYVDIMVVFQKMGVMPMAVLAENAVWESQQYLNNKAISAVLFCHGTEMDAYRLKEFLKRIVRADLFPRPEKKWDQMHIDDMRLAVPRTKNPWILTCLIRASLCCQQFSIAEAYAKEFCRRDSVLNYSGQFKCWIVTTFIHTYTRVASWRAGLVWINQAIDWMTDMLEMGENLFGRVILRILEHCVVCGQRDAYSSLLRACIVAELPLPSIDESKPHLISVRMSEIRKDWASQLRPQCRGGVERPLPQDQLLEFQRTLKNIFVLNSGVSIPTFLEEDARMESKFPPQLDGPRSKTFTRSPSPTNIVSTSVSNYHYSPIVDDSRQLVSDAQNPPSIRRQSDIPAYDFWPRMQVSESTAPIQDYRPFFASESQSPPPQQPEVLEGPARGVLGSNEEQHKLVERNIVGTSLSNPVGP